MSVRSFMMNELISGLPVSGIASQVNAMLAEHGRLVVTAPPGAGKSTVLPLTVLSSIRNGKILMLEPRRLAARQVAERMASLMGEPVGETVGYSMRFDRKVSSRTRVEVVTEGVMTRILVSAPTLEGISVVIFDEFHERSLTSDLALALVRESQRLIRPDLRILIMSATIDSEGICKALDAPSISSEGRMFPVKVVHPSCEATAENCADAVAHIVRQAHREQEGDILAFLPGEREIRKCQERLGDALGSTSVCPLFGYLPPAEQRQAIIPSPHGKRKVVLATPIAETSLTIEGVRVVVDSGLYRKLVFNPQTSLSRLETLRISMDMAAQRTGRAGRVDSGICYRLWSAATERNMAACRIPEILDADLSSMALDTLAWGESSPEALPWLTPPPEYHLRQAMELLYSLGAAENLDGRARITAHGRAMAALPCHPRIAQILLAASAPEKKALATDIAALLEEKDPLAATAETADIYDRLLSLRSTRSGRMWHRIEMIAEQYRKIIKTPLDNGTPDPFETGDLISAAYPERIGKSLPEGHGRFLLASGDIASLDISDPLAREDFLAVASVNIKAGADGRIFLASRLDPKDVIPRSREVENISWDSKIGTVVARREWRVGRLLLDSRPINEEIRDKVVKVICEAAVKEGTGMLDFSSEVGNLQRRIAAVASWHPELMLPDLSTETFLQRAPQWMPLFIGKATSRAELRKINLCEVMWSLLDYEQQKEVDRLAPSHIQVPTGSRIRVEYRLGAEAPVLRVRLQECFGMTDTPKVDDGKRPVLMELLSPGFKPVQLTSDLRSFWEGAYFEVRKELRRRYPKHSWPDNPLDAPAVRGTGKRHI
jgi:ATP-dependent helicase HrpB